MKLTVEFDRELDGRCIAEVSALPGVLAYGRRREPKTLKQIQFIAPAA